MKLVSDIHTLSFKIKYLTVFRLAVFLAVCLSIVVSSCRFENEVECGKDSEVIAINILTAPTLFTQQTTAESYISQMKALVYVYDGTNYRFDYFAEIQNVYHSNGYTTFVLNLYGESRAVKVTIIANADDAVTAANPSFGEAETTINLRINKNFTPNGISENLPMWGEFLFPDGISSSMARNTEYGARSLRTLARVDINALSVVSNFEMVTIQVYRANSLMQLVPDNFTTNPLMVDSPSIPPSSTANVNTLPIVVSGNTSLSQLYLPESAAPDLSQQIGGATCVVVGGRFNGSPITTYYRLDFAPPTPGYPLGQILRNHQYTFNIVSVSGPGWSTPDDAANNVASHIVADVLDWTDIYTNVNIDGSNFFFIPYRSVDLPGQINSVSTIDVLTDIQNCVLYWSDALGNPTDNNTGVTIVNYYFSATISSTNIEIQALDYNDYGNGTREQYFTVAAGRLRIPIKITQAENPFVHQSRWSQFNVDQFGAFTTSINDFGQLYVFGNTTPFSTAGVVSNWPTGTPSATWTVQNDPCPTGWRMPRSNDLIELAVDYSARRVYNGTDPANPNSGIWIAPTQSAVDNATFANPGSALFFPFAGIRNSAQNGTGVNGIGIYWSNHTDGNWRVLTASFSNNIQSNSLIDIRTPIIGYSVRCIRDL